MRSRRPDRRLFCAAGALLALAGAGGLSGCLAYKVVAAPVKLAATTAVVAGETATAVVTNTGKLAVSAANATGSVGSTGIDAAAKLAQAGMVTFVDGSNGSIVRIPWREGLSLSGAGSAAQVEIARRAIQVLRAGRVIFSGARGSGGAPALASGDVVRLGS